MPEANATATNHEEASNAAAEMISAVADALASNDIPPALTRSVESTISFKTPKGEDGKPLTDELGQPIAKKASFKLTYPVPTLDGVIVALKDEKQREWILDILANEVYRNVRLQVADESRPVTSQEDLDVSKLSLSFLANQPASERRGGGIAKEVWEAWAKDYIAIMPSVSGKAADKVQNAAALFLKKFQPVKTQKQVLGYLETQLDLWAASTQSLEEFADCYEFLSGKLKDLLEADEASLLSNL